MATKSSNSDITPENLHFLIGMLIDVAQRAGQMESVALLKEARDALSLNAKATRVMVSRSWPSEGGAVDY